MNFHTRLLTALAFSALFSCKASTDVQPEPTPPAGNGTVGVWLTKGDKSKLLSRETDLTTYPQESTSWPIIRIDTTTKLQTMEGFGAALTGSSAYLLHQKLSDGARQTVLRKLFDTVNGAGISYLRLTMGASDFSLSDFTYDDLPAGQTDFQLQKFSLAQDTGDVIPVLKDILQISPSIRLMGTPWSPPAWMKTNGNLKGGALKSDCEDVYADYFVKYILGMKSSGIAITSVTPQNEPLYFTAGYPCMEMQATGQAAFIRDHLGPKFVAAGILSKIIVFDHNWDNYSYPITVLNDPDARKFIAGSAFHGYAGDVSSMSAVHNVHPDKELYFTEISGGAWATDFGSNLMWNMRNIFIGSILNWSKAALLWNLALDQDHGPTNHGCSDCRGVVTINATSGQVTYNEEYYSIVHFSKFIRPGAARVTLTLPPAISNLGATAFLNPDGSKVIVLSNYSNSQQTVAISQGKKNFSWSIPAQSVVTMVWF